MKVGTMSLVHRALLRRGEFIFDGHLRRELILVIHNSHGRQAGISPPAGRRERNGLACTTDRHALSGLGKINGEESGGGERERERKSREGSKEEELSGGRDGEDGVFRASAG